MLGLAQSAAIRPSLRDPGIVEVTIGSGSSRMTIPFAEPRLIAFLLALPRSQERSACAELLQRFVTLNDEQARRVVDSLVEARILEAPTQADRAAELWERHGWADALDFQQATQDLVFTGDPGQYLESMTTLLEATATGQDEALPGPFVTHEGADRIPLRRSDETIVSASLGAVLRSRRASGPFRSGGLDLERLSGLLQHAYSASSIHDGVPGPCFKRNSPSAGSLQPIELYLVANDVGGLDPGAYHYLPEGHELELLRRGDLRAEAAAAGFDVGGIADAPAIAVLTARWARNMWKYRYSRAYRMVHFDAGHLMQTHVLTAAALGLHSGVCLEPDETRCARMLQLGDDAEEGVLCAIGIGL